MIDFEVEFLQNAKEFLDELDEKARDKIMFNIWKVKYSLDSELFKKLTPHIWEFRTLYNKQYLRLFAFWDKTESGLSLIIVTNGIIKKTKRTPRKEIHNAERIRKEYVNTNTIK